MLVAGMFLVELVAQNNATLQSMGSQHLDVQMYRMECKFPSPFFGACFAVYARADGHMLNRKHTLPRKFGCVGFCSTFCLSTDRLCICEV